MLDKRFVGGIICMAIAVIILVTPGSEDRVPPAVAILVVGIALVATSRRRKT